MASLITVRLNKDASPNWGFRLQGGMDFGTPLIIQKVNSGTPAERAGLVPGDSVIKINNIDVFNLRHKDAQDVVVRAGNNFDMTIQRGGSTWKPQVIPTGTYATHSPTVNNISPVTKTSLHAKPSENIGAIGTGHNVSAKPFGGQVNGSVNGGPKLVNKQYNSPLKIYSEQSIAETLSAQTEVLSTGALGVNFKKNEKDYDATKSAVYHMLQEAEHDPRTPDQEPDSGIVTSPNSGIAGLRHVSAPENRPKPANPQLPPGQNICADCERLIVGVFVRIKDKNLHVECFKCATCGSSLKNVGYYNINNKLYCDIHAKAAVINNPPSPNLVPVTVQPGGKVPATAISAALASHSLPSPSPLSPKTNSFGSPYQPQELNSNNVPATPSQSLIMTVEPTAVAKPISNPSSPQTPTTNNSLNNNIYNNSTPLSFSKYLNKSGNLSSPKPFSSVSAPTPQSTLPRPGPLSPRSPVGTPAAPIFSPPASAGRCVSNVIWPPPQEEQEFPTACPLYFPPPSQVEAQILAHRAEKEESEFSYSEYTDYEEMAYYQQPKLSICSEEISGFIERKSATECIETISESLETQKLVESVMKTRPRSPPPLDTNVIPCSESIIQNVPCCQKRKDSCELKRPTQFTPNTLECQLSSQIPNPVPQGWESPMLQALRIAPDAFSQIPSKRSSSALASALKIAPAEPFTPAPTNILDPVPLPEETVPYFPPEHAIVIEPKEPKPKTEKKPESQFVKALAIAPDRPFTPVGGVAPVKKKVVDPLDKFIQELPKPQEKLTMTTALTTAPDRPYTPIFLEQTELNQSITQETRTKEKIDRSVLTKPLMPAKLPDSFHPPQPEPKPILKELPPILIQETEEKERKNEQDTKHVRIIEKHELKPAVPATITKYRLEDPEPPTTHFAPIFQGFSCSYQDKQFSVEVVTTPPILTPTPTEKSHSASSIAISEGKSGYIQKETIREETSSRQKSSEKQVRQMTTTRPSEVVKQAEQIVLKKPLPLASALHPVGALPQYQVNLSQEAEAEIKRMEKIEKAQIRLEQQKIVQQESHNIAPPKPIRQPSHEGIKKPIITLQPGDNQPMRSQTFKPVIEDKPASTTFSPRPRSITPSMINKSPAVLPYYQANLVAHHCPPPTINLLDPTSPAISRSPSPCPGARERSPSPFPGSGAAASRPKSPAAGPPPNPLRDIHPLPTPKDSKVRMAKENLTTFIPQYKEKRDLIEKVQGMDFYKRNDELSSQSLEEQYNQQTQMTQTQQWQEQQQIQQTQQSQQHQIQQQQIQKQQVLQMQKSQQQQIQQQQQDIERQQIQHEIQRQQQKHAVEQQRLQQGQPIQMYTSQVQTQNYSVPQTQQFETSFMACQETSDATSREKKMQMQNVQIQDSQKAESHSAQTAQGSITTSVSEKSHQEHLEDRKCSQKQSVQTSADGRCQIQRKQTVTEEYEHSQKAKVIEIQKNVSSSGCKKHPFRDVNPPIVDQPGVMGLHLTNPQPLSSPFIKADNCGSLPQLPQVDPKSVCPPCVKSQIQKPHPEILNTPPPPPVRKVFAPGSQGPIKHVKAPGSQQPNQNVIKSNVPSSNIGSSSGRQISAIGAPRRGRGVLNAAAIGGARIPLCGQCHKQIRGPFITALGKIWCPDHFICTTPSCRRPLQDIGFVEEHGQLYCEYCFEQYLAPPCSKCNGKIKGDCLKAIGKNFHPECFNCVYCGKLFGNNPFFLEDGNPYCEADWNELFTTKCYACGFPVEAGDRWVEALNNNYHSQCFNCTMCKKNLEGQSFFAKGGRPFCKTHAR